MNPLLLKYLNSVKVFDVPNDQGKAPEKPEIKVDSVDNRGKAKTSLDPNDTPKEEEEDNDEDNDEDEKKEEDFDDNGTAEQKAARVAQEKEDRKEARMQKRIDKLTATNANAANEIAELKKQLAEKPVEGLTEEEVERRAAKKAEELATAKEADRQQKDFEKTANSLIKDAIKIDKDFEKKINEVAKETDTLMPKYMVEILSDLDHKNGSEILAQLASDADLYEEICSLSERRMTRRLDKMSEELKGKGKVITKTKEKALPDPIEPINDGSSNKGNSLPSKPTQNMDDYVRVRNQQVAEARKQGRNIY